MFPTTTAPAPSDACKPPPAAVAAVETLVAEHAAQHAGGRDPEGSPGSPDLAWYRHRLTVMEGQRQTLHVERDEARARVVDLEAYVAALKDRIREILSPA